MNKVCKCIVVIGLAALQSIANGQESRLYGKKDTDYLVYNTRTYENASNFKSTLSDSSPSISLMFDVNGLWMISPNIKDFKATDDDYQEAEIDSSSSFGLAQSFGLGITSKNVDFNLMYTKSVVISYIFTSYYDTYSIETLFRVGESVKIGFLAGVMTFEDTKCDSGNLLYFGDLSQPSPDTEFKGGTGYQCGLIILIGSDRVSFIARVSYLDFAYDVIDARDDPSKTWTVNDKELDISGTMVHLGIRIKF